MRPLLPGGDGPFIGGATVAAYSPSPPGVGAGETCRFAEGSVLTTKYLEVQTGINILNKLVGVGKIRVAWFDGSSQNVEYFLQKKQLLNPRKVMRSAEFSQ